MEEIITANETAEAEEAVAEEQVIKKKQRKPINQAKLQDNLWGWIFCIPLIIGTVWFVYICFVVALLLSFTDYTIIGGGNIFSYLQYLGQRVPTATVHLAESGKTQEVTGPFAWYIYAFTNFTTTPFRIHEMGAMLFNTVFYMIGIPIGMILSMFFAVCMSRDIKGGNVFRVLYYFPCVASTISIVYTFKLMFSQTGVMNSLLGLQQVGITDSPLQWVNITGANDWSWNFITGGTSESAFMNDPFWCQGIISKLVIIIMSVWKGLGGTIILYIAGLSGVNGATKEAAQIDGANGWTIFWKVTMPDLYPTIFYNIVTSVIGGMQIYAEPELFIANRYYLSGYVWLVWNYGLNGGVNAVVSEGAAYGMILAVIIFILTMFQFWLDSRNKD